jgi:uncharacterized GH25 family protein/peroxiredoxin
MKPLRFSLFFGVIAALMALLFIVPHWAFAQYIFGTTFNGAVIGSDGKPAPNVNVTLVRPFNHDKTLDDFTGVTDASGQFRINITNGFYVSTIIAETPTEIGIEETPVNGPIQLVKKMDTRVRLLDEMGKPVANAPLSIDHLAKGQHNINQFPVQDVKTDSDGYATFRNLPQDYRLYINHKDDRYANFTPSDYIDLISSSVSNITEFRLAPAGSISGKIIYAGDQKPRRNLQINIESIGWQNPGQYVQTDSSGFFKATRLHEGIYRIKATGQMPPGLISNSVNWVVVRKGQNITNQNISITPGALITGKVTLKNGQPVPSASISAYDSSTREWLGSSRTDVNGVYEIRTTAGMLLLDVYADHIRYREKVVKSVEGQIKKLNFDNPLSEDGSLINPPKAPKNPQKATEYITIHCALHTSGGQPVAGAFISYFSANMSNNTNSDENGKATFQVRPSDNAYIYARAENMVVKALAPTSIDKTDYDITLYPASDFSTLTGSVSDENGEPLAGATVSITTRIKTTEGNEITLYSPLNTTTNSNGKFSFTGISIDQSCQVNVYKSGYEQKIIEQASKAAENTRMDPIKLTPATSFIAGKLVNGFGKPIADALIKHTESDGKDQYIITDASGTFRFEQAKKQNEGILYYTSSGLQNWGPVESNNPNVIVNTSTPQNGASNTIFKAGTIAPDFTAKDLSDRTITLSKLKGKVVVLDFWDVSEEQSVRELPYIIDIHEKYHEKGVVVVGFSLAKERQDLVDAVHENEIDFSQVYYPRLFDSNGLATPILHLYNVSMLPLCIVIGKDGRIIGSNLKGPDIKQGVLIGLGMK